MEEKGQNKKLFIHIGAHKTGTTAIQNFLALNREKLKNRGFLYPGSANNHYRLSQEIRHDENVVENTDSESLEIINEIRENYNSCHSFILSSEGFWEIIPPKHPQILKDFISKTGLEFDIKILLYCRSQDTWLESAYQQQIKQVNVRSVQTFREIIDKKLFFVTIDYYTLLSNWSDAFGKESITARIYEKHSKGDGLLDDFCDFVEIYDRNRLVKPSLSQSNIGLRPESIEFLRYLNLLEIHKNDFLEIVDILSGMEKNPIGQYNFLSAYDRKSIQEYFSESNTKLAASYINCAPEELFPADNNVTDSKPLDQSRIDVDSLSMIIEYLSAINEELVNRINKQVNSFCSTNNEINSIRNELLSNFSVFNTKVKSEKSHNNSLQNLETRSISQQFQNGKPVFKIDSGNFLRKVKRLSQDIKGGVKVESNSVKITSIGKDPYFVIKSLKIAGKDLLFRFHINFPSDTFIEIFYQTKNNRSFSQEFAVRKEVNKGENIVFISLKKDDFTGVLRIDIGMHKGVYFIHEIEIKEVKTSNRRDKRVYIHVGPPKTGSSSIQHTLGRNRETLLAKDLLYPVFNFQNKRLFNHSIPFVSICWNKPEPYYILDEKGLSGKLQRKRINDDFKKQFCDQMELNPDMDMIISGEGIATLNLDELKYLRSFLEKNIVNPLDFTIIIVIRNYLSRALSMVQQRVKSGYTLSQAISYVLTIASGFYSSILNKMSEIFNQEDLQFLKFEELVKHPDNISAGFLNQIRKDIRIQNDTKIINKNSSLTYEAVEMLSYINDRRINTEGKPPIHVKLLYNMNDLFNFPGKKFGLSTEFQKLFWERSETDREILKDKFGIETEAFNPLEEDSSMNWSETSVAYLKGLIKKSSGDTRKYMNEFLEQL